MCGLVSGWNSAICNGVTMNIPTIYVLSEARGRRTVANGVGMRRGGTDGENRWELIADYQYFIWAEAHLGHARNQTRERLGSGVTGAGRRRTAGGVAGGEWRGVRCSMRMLAPGVGGRWRSFSGAFSVHMNIIAIGRGNNRRLDDVGDRVLVLFSSRPRHGPRHVVTHYAVGI